MHGDVKLSTRFITDQNAHQVRMLVSVKGDPPAARCPVNLALVLDRSGSMAGPPLEQAKRAAARFAGFLGAEDRLTIVAFDDTVQTLCGPGSADDLAVQSLIRAIHTGGGTNLSGGWLEGRSHVQGGLMDGPNRVVLFTDGQAIRGITSREQLTSLAGGASESGVSTTCIGFGPQFDEHLLRSMSDAGGGNFWYIETEDQMTPVFEEEIEGLVSLAAQNVKVTVNLIHPRVHGVSLVQDYPATRTPEGGWVVSIGDLYGTAGRALGIVFHVENVSDLGEVPLGTVRVSADAVGTNGVEHRVLTMPVVANLAEDHVEPEVERTLLRFEASRARTEAVRRADVGDFDGAATALRHAATGLRPYVDDPGVREEVEDLQWEAVRMERRDYRPEVDAKYHMARSISARDLKAGYTDKIARARLDQARLDAHQAERLPLQFCRGYLLVDLARGRWLLDSGAPASFSDDPSVSIAGRPFRIASSFAGVGVADVSQSVGVGVSGVLGADVLGQFDVLFDVGRAQVTIAAGPLELNGTAVPLAAFTGVSMLPARIGGVDYRMTFETGARLSYFLHPSLASFPSAGRIRDFFPGVGEFETETHLVDVTIGGAAFRLRCGVPPQLLASRLRIAGADGIIGNDILRDRPVGWFPRRKLLVLG